jgi:serine/threonine protein kinase
MQRFRIIHRDIKPENILLTDANLYAADIKLADFGLSKRLDTRSNLTMTRVGTPFYSAPELNGQGQYDWTVDLWSVGTTLFECLTGFRPFDVTDLRELNLL